MGERRTVDEMLNNSTSWQLKIDSCVYHLDQEDGRVETIKWLADENMQCEQFFRLSRGHLPFKKIIELGEEVRYLLDKYDEEIESVQMILEDIVETADYHKQQIEQNEIEDYISFGEDVWFLPGGLMNLVRVCGLGAAFNLPFEGKELFDFLGKIERRYPTLIELGVIPYFTEEEIFEYNKRTVNEDGSRYFIKNEEIVENLVRIDLDKVRRRMEKKEYDDKYKLYCIYKYYTPSKIVLDKVRDFAESYLTVEELKELEIIFMPSMYEGYAEAREFFGDDERYAFTGEVIHMTFDSILVDDK